MKADEYVKIAREMLTNPPLQSTIWRDTPPEEDGPADEQDIVVDVIRRLLGEVKTIADVRKANTDAAIVSIMRELRQKWFAICDRMSHPMFVRTSFDAFLKVLDDKTPRRPVRPTNKPRPKED